MIDELEALTALGGALVRRARSKGLRLVWRAQARRYARVVVRDGRTEETVRVRASGHGIQIVDDAGRTVLGSRDDFETDAALALLDRLADADRHAASLGIASGTLPELPPTRGREIPEAAAGHAGLDLARLRRRLAELEAEIAGRVPGVKLALSCTADLDAWRVFRDDGTDVLFAMPRAVLRMSANPEGAGARFTVGTSVSGPSADLAWDEVACATFLRRAEEAARLATALPSAPPHPAGSFPLVIDYALAKGLAHEAFGHASEADGFRASILAEAGRFRRGHRVGAPHVSIVDEPVRGDHAWQPYSANGVPRSRATLVDHGRLHDALTDPWSAASSGTDLTGAERAESFRHAPIPRMTNIRIELDDPHPAPGTFEDYGPAEVRDLLAAAGVFRRHAAVAYLSGYTGGQVNTVGGDFVFNCRAIHTLGPDGCTLHRPAIFSGSMFGALESIREGFGPLRLDAIGTCGKWGQSVPSSGGSHWFLVLEPHPSVRLGGR